ncbi:MAG: TetR/AcrR family transcriptional regulator [Bacilli bacterium]|jgi:AcrR family transcriptional regulator|nr:TetR/AcrR family transcriptional regulator [Bacilli bacterium]
MANRKEEATIERINQALETLIKAKNYNAINVSDIIETSGVSRSTFYAHFKSKDEVLEKICSRIFDHVFSHSLEKEEDHDFSKTDVFDYDHMITHIFYHFRDSKELIRAILSSSGSHLFLTILSEKVTPLIKALIHNGLVGAKNVPEEIEQDQITSSLVEMLKMYCLADRKETPEEMTAYFLTMYGLKA